jgi:hypothetical protein
MISFVSKSLTYSGFGTCLFVSKIAFLKAVNFVIFISALCLHFREMGVVVSQTVILFFG